MRKPTSPAGRAANAFHRIHDLSAEELALCRRQGFLAGIAATLITEGLILLAAIGIALWRTS